MAVALSDHIDVLELTVRARNCLTAESFTTIGVLVSRTKRQLYRIPNMGNKSIAEIEAALALHGLTLADHPDALAKAKAEAKAKAFHKLDEISSEEFKASIAIAKQYTDTQLVMLRAILLARIDERIDKIIADLSK